MLSLACSAPFSARIGQAFDGGSKLTNRNKENTTQESVRSEETCMYHVYIVFPTNIA